MVPPLCDPMPVALQQFSPAEWAAAIVARHSARTFTSVLPEAGDLEHLERFVAALPGEEAARVVVVRDLPAEVFTGVIGSYGKVVGAHSGLIVIGNETVPCFQEAAGYLGEAAILEAKRRGLDTCWVGGFFDRSVTEKLVRLSAGERILAVSPLGYAQTRQRAGERMLKRFVGAHKRRPIEEIAPGFDDEVWPAWAAEGVRLARVAPSAVNRQPWEFRFEAEVEAEPSRGPSYSGPTGAVTIAVVERGLSGSVSRRLDCGIAMLHFEVGARLMGGAGSWELIEPPGLARYRVMPPTEETSSHEVPGGTGS